MASKADVFAIGIPSTGPSPSSAHAPTDNPFAGTRRITLPQNSPDAPAATLDVFAGDPSRVATYYDHSHDRAIYLLGRASHPALERGPELLRWIGEASQRECVEPLRNLLGNFVVLIDDRRARRIRFVTDVMGLRPWIVGQFNNRLVAGTNVLDICKAGLSTGSINYDSVAMWLTMNHVLSEETIVHDYHFAAAGAVSIYESCGCLIASRQHSQFRFGFDKTDQPELVEQLHEFARRSFDAQTRGVREVNIPLSGGFDSRLLLAMAVRAGIKVHASNIESIPSETIIAKQVAETLHAPLRVLPIGQHILDIYDDPFAMTAGGFPTGKNLTCRLAGLHPDMPLLAGFMGDRMMRGPLAGTLPEFFKRDAMDLPVTELAPLIFKQYHYVNNRLHMLDPTIVEHAEERSKSAIRHTLEISAMPSGKPLSFVDLYYRHRRFFAGNFLQHLDIAEAITVYPCFDLIASRQRHIDSAYQPNNHSLLFPKFYPEIAHIPHNRKSDHPQSEDKGPTRHIRAWGFDIFKKAIAGNGHLRAASRKKLLRRGVYGILGSAKHQHDLAFLAKLSHFENHLHAAKLHLDWSLL